MLRLCDRIGVIGNGFVGRAIARGFMEHCGEVRIHDVMPERSTHTLEQACDCDWTFVCVPTPSRHDGRCDTSAVEDVIGKAWALWSADGNLPRAPRLVIKSTVPVGFTRMMHSRYGDGKRGLAVTILHSPEFLTQRCALVDFQTPARNIVGNPLRKEADAADTDAAVRTVVAADELCQLYEQRFPGVSCIRMSSDESELVKLAQNGFFATKVAYFNAIYLLAKSGGMDWDAVRSGIMADGRIAHAHTEVPGPDGKLGFGGGCLPKDLNNLIRAIDDAGFCGDFKWLEDMARWNHSALRTNGK